MLSLCSRPTDVLSRHGQHVQMSLSVFTTVLQAISMLVLGIHVPCSRACAGLHGSMELLHAAGSCLVLKGNGADVSQHCVPPVSARRMSITLRRYLR